MTIEEVKKKEDIGDVMTVEEFMDCVHSSCFLSSDGSGVFVFKEDKKGGQEARLKFFKLYYHSPPSITEQSSRVV